VFGICIPPRVVVPLQNWGDGGNRTKSTSEKSQTNDGVDKERVIEERCDRVLGYIKLKGGMSKSPPPVSGPPISRPEK